jgi:hypothetical protein
MEKPDSEPVQIMIACEQCNFLSEDLTACSECGNSLVIDISGNVEDGLNLGKEVLQTKLNRKREITPLGMYLKEQKKNLKELKSARNLDLASAFQSWGKLSEEEKAKYKQMSLRDKELVRSQAGRKETLFAADEKKERNRIKNMKDAERMAIERKNIEMLKKDVHCSKTLVSAMLVEKREALLGLDKDVGCCQEEIENLSRELLVSEKLVEVKKGKLRLLKKEYKELFVRRNNCAEMK